MDDQSILADVFKELGIKNEVVFCSDGEKALDYLTKTSVEPFIIFSDIDMH